MIISVHSPSKLIDFIYHRTMSLSQAKRQSGCPALAQLSSRDAQSEALSHGHWRASATIDRFWLSP
jgi:hypothetical protein